jgi:tetratricopeptide (TPR) repeat protein
MKPSLITMKPSACGRSMKTYLNRASAYRKKGQNERAIADYQKALELSPDLDIAKTKLLELGVKTL